MAARSTSRAKRKSSAKVIPPSARRVRGGLKCPDCDFVARHAMGLGRHRSARHGVASRRSALRGTGGRWITRGQAAERADVHYNTIRQWEHAGLVKTVKRPGLRGLLLSADDLERFLVERGGYQTIPSGGASDAAVRALQKRYDRLIRDLEQLLEVAKTARPSVDGRTPAKKRAGKTKAKAKPKPKTRAKRRAAPKRRAKPRRRR